MLKDVVSKLDYSNFDEFALLLFAATFLVIVWGAFRLSKDATDRFSAIPLSDSIQDPFKLEPSEKGVRSLLCEAPEGRVPRKRVLTPFSHDTNQKEMPDEE